MMTQLNKLLSTVVNYAEAQSGNGEWCSALPKLHIKNNNKPT
jgi:hypothetical protein